MLRESSQTSSLTLLSTNKTLNGEATPPLYSHDRFESPNYNIEEAARHESLIPISK